MPGWPFLVSAADSPPTAWPASWPASPAIYPGTNNKLKQVNNRVRSLSPCSVRPSRRGGGPMSESDRPPAELDELRQEAAALEEEVLSLRRKLQEAPKRVRTLEERLLESKGQLAQAVSQNEKLSYMLREAREHIASLRDEVDKLTQPPAAYGVMVGKNDDGTVDVLASGRKMRVNLHPEIDLEGLERGSE